MYCCGGTNEAWSTKEPGESIQLGELRNTIGPRPLLWTSGNVKIVLGQPPKKEFGDDQHTDPRDESQPPFWANPDDGGYRGGYSSQQDADAHNLETC